MQNQIDSMNEIISFVISELDRIADMPNLSDSAYTQINNLMNDTYKKRKQILDLLIPPEKPCDCIKYSDGYFSHDCDCHNSGDLTQAAEWCNQANLYEKIKTIIDEG